MRFTKEIKTVKHQAELIRSKYKQSLLVGDWATGKTYALCLAILQEASEPNKTIIMVRKHMQSMVRSTLLTLLDILPNGSYTIDKTNRKITLNGSKSSIYYIGMEEVYRLRVSSLSPDLIAIDQAEELTLDEYDLLYRRLRKDGSRLIATHSIPFDYNYNSNIKPEPTYLDSIFSLANEDSIVIRAKDFNAFNKEI